MNIYKLKNKLAENNFSIVYELISDELRENVTGIAFSHVKKLNDEYDALQIKLKIHAFALKLRLMHLRVEFLMSRKCLNIPSRRLLVCHLNLRHVWY